MRKYSFSEMHQNKFDKIYKYTLKHFKNLNKKIITKSHLIRVGIIHIIM